MSKKNPGPSALDWFYYWGSKDERLRQVADRAGHRVFLPVFLLAAVDFLVRWPAVVAADYATWPTVLASALTVLVGGPVYCLLWVRGGFTIFDTGRQRTGAQILTAAAGLIVLVYVGLTLGDLKDLGWFSWLVAAAFGALASALTWGGYLVMDRRARKAADDLSGPAD